MKKEKKKKHYEIRDYDSIDTSRMVNTSKPLRFEDLGVRLPETPPTQVISIRLPSKLLNELKAISSQRDVPYQVLIKLFLSESISHFKKRSVV